MVAGLRPKVAKTSESKTEYIQQIMLNWTKSVLKSTVSWTEQSCDSKKNNWLNISSPNPFNPLPRPRRHHQLYHVASDDTARAPAKARTPHSSKRHSGPAWACFEEPHKFQHFSILWVPTGPHLFNPHPTIRVKGKALLKSARLASVTSSYECQAALMRSKPLLTCFAQGHVLFHLL